MRTLEAGPAGYPTFPSMLLSSVALGLPTSLAFNLPPSSTFLNQAAALIGWGAWLLLVSSFATRRAGGVRGIGALQAALTLLLVAALLLSVPLVMTYLDTGLVPRFPTAILVTGMTIIAVLCFFAGLILDTVTRGRREMRRLAYLAQPSATD